MTRGFPQVSLPLEHGKGSRVRPVDTLGKTMHELSIAMNIVDIASRHAGASSASSVAEVELDIGTMAGIEYESLRFALSVATRDTILEHATFRINRVEPLAECLTCHHSFSPERMLGSCPGCGSKITRLVRGRELFIKSLLIE